MFAFEPSICCWHIEQYWGSLRSHGKSRSSLVLLSTSVRDEEKVFARETKHWKFHWECCCSYLKLEKFSEALTMMEKYESWKLLGTRSNSEADEHIEAMRKEATEGLARQRKMAKLEEKKAAKKVKVVKVTAEMVAESDKHEAELLDMIGAEPIAPSSRGSVVGTS